MSQLSTEVDVSVSSCVPIFKVDPNCLALSTIIPNIQAAHGLRQN